jgi:TrpR-related protein YerC/YecD
MKQDFKKNDIEALYKAILTLENQEECRRFFEDICTVVELKAISQRLNVAKMLAKKCVYSEIVEQTGASTATISRVNRSLSYGNDGYSIVIERLGENE